jgi:HlyD family secretion protein
MLSPLLRRLLVALLLLLLLAAGVWWATRPEPVAVVLKGDRTRAGRIDDRQYPCRDGRSLSAHPLSTITGGRIEVLAVKEGDRVRRASC